MTLNRTSLYDTHIARGARMVPFAGWEMPMQYTSPLEEHATVRAAAGLFDIDHMGQVIVEGPDAIRVVREMAGATDGLEAAPGTIRGDYGSSRQMNLVHASDGPEAAKREIELFFSKDEIHPFASPLRPWLYMPEEQ